jgi:hypothetical protein
VLSSLNPVPVGEMGGRGGKEKYSSMWTTILWCASGLLAIVWGGLFVALRRDHGIWKTKKDFSFNEIDRLLGSQDYRAEVSKYLHKYKSDRRWYENTLVREAVLLALVTLLLAAAVIAAVVTRAFA